MRARVVAGLAALLVAGATPLPAAQALADAPTIRTLAGSDGQGPARAVSQAPADVLVEGDRMLVADALFGVVRETDLSSGVQRVLHRHPSVPGPLAVGDTSSPQPYPMALARARDGGLYVSQRAHHRVVKIGVDGRSEVVAGNGRRGYLGDGGPAAQASLAEPAGLAVDAAGNLLIADQGNHAVRLVAPNGTISTFAGAPGPAEGCDYPIYHAWASGSLCPEPGHAGDGGPADRALLDGPARIRLAPGGGVLVAGVGDHAPLRRVAPDGTVSTLAGRGATPDRLLHSDLMCSYEGDANAYRFGVHDVAALPDGQLLIATGGVCVHRLDPATGAMRLFAGGGQRGGVLDDGDGGPAKAGVFWEITSLVAHAGRLLVAEPRWGRVRMVDASGRLSTVAGATARSVFQQTSVVPHFAAGTGAPAPSAQLPATTGLAVSPDGGVYVADRLESVVRRIEPDGLVRPVVGQPASYGELPGPTPAGQAILTGPAGLAVTADGSLYLADGGRAVRRLRPDGVLEAVAGGHECKTDLGDGDPALGTELHEVSDVTPGARGGLYLVEALTGHLRHIDPQGRMHILVGPRERPCSQNGEGVTWHFEGSPLAHATGVASSPDGSVWVTTRECLHRVTAVDVVECVVPLAPLPPEEYDRQARFGGFPTGARPDVVVERDGAVVFTDPYARAVRRRGLDGAVTTVAGNGANACAASSVPAAATSLAVPTQLALHPDGSVVVADAACRSLHRIGAPETETAARAAGPDRLATAVHASRATFSDGAARAVVLARSDDYADALTGTPLAVRSAGPLLLTPSRQLAAWPESELRRVLPRGGTVYLLGGEAALAPQVAARVVALGYSVVRLAGRDRYATAVTVAERGLGAPRRVLLTTGTGFADALGAAVAAAEVGAAVLLTAGQRPAAATADYLSRHGVAEHYAVGGPAALASPASVPLVGADRYATAAAVAARFFPAPTSVALVTGSSFPDALSGGAAIGALGGPLLLTATSSLSAGTRAYLTERRPSVQHVLVVGGESAVSAQTRAAAAAAAR